MTKIQKVCVHKGESDEVLLAIGKLAVDAAAFDYFLSFLKGVLTGNPSPNEPPVMEATFAGPKCKEIKVLAGQKGEAEIVALMDRASSVIERRNLHIHGVFTLPEDAKDAPGLVMLKGPFKGKTNPRSIEEINSTLADLNQIMGEVLFYSRKLAPGLVIDDPKH